MKLYLSNFYKLLSIILFFNLLFWSCGNAIKEEDETESINLLMDNWHHAAAIADEDVFFGSMTEDCIYLGTDITEKWKRDELKSWSEKFFQREIAWAFTPSNREVYLQNGIAWMDEELDTWMGKCRASGVLKKTDQGWKISHYQLSVAVPNEKMPEYLKIFEETVKDTTLPAQ